MQLPAGAPFPRRLSVDRHGDIMILRTPIISESYSPDESAIADAKNTKICWDMWHLNWISSR